MLIVDGEGTPTAEQAIEQIGADITETEATAAEAVASPPAKAPEVDPATSTAQPRDPAGRFAEKVPTSAAQAPPAGTPTETPAEPTAPEAASGVAEETESYPVADYRADGQAFEIPGSAVGDDGVFIPNEVWQRQVLPLLSSGQSARGGSLQRRMQESAQQVQHWQQQAQAAQAQSQAIVAKIDQMVENGSIGQWLEGVHQNWPIMKAQAEANAVRLQAQFQAQQLQQYQAEQQRVALEPQFSTALEQSLRHYGAQTGLTEEQLVGLYRQLDAPEMRNAWRVQVQQDDPLNGLRAGEWAINNQVIEQWVHWASQYQPRTATPGVPAKIAEAQAQNAKRASNAPPPVVGAKGGQAPSGKPPAPKYKDGKEALRKLFDENEFQNFEVAGE